MRVVVIRGFSKAKNHAMNNEHCIVTGEEKGGLMMQYRAKAGVLFCRKQENMHLPQDMGWATAKMQEIKR